MKEEWSPIKVNVSLADASLLTFSFDDLKQSVSVRLSLWNENKINIIFEDVIYFLYKPGDYVKGIYQANTGSPTLIDAVTREFETVPLQHKYKLMSVKDINDFNIIEIVCSSFYFE